MSQQDMVREFHKEFGFTITDKPSIPGSTDILLRLQLIDEELGELEEAFYNDDIIGVADALGDLLYVVYGAAVTCGIPLDKVFEEIHRSNMTKSKERRPGDGKPIKPDTYSPPDLDLSWD